MAVTVKALLAAGVLGFLPSAGAPAAWAQAPAAPSAASPAQGEADLPRRRPEEAQADPLRAFDITKDGKLDAAEVKSAAAARFDEMNPDQDNSLDEREAAPVLQGEAFHRVDTNGDGKISKAEYLAYAERLFDLANPDRDGTLDRAELETEAGRELLQLLR